MRSLVEVHQRLRELKNERDILEAWCEENDTDGEYDGEFEGMFNRIQELNWVLGITD